MDARSKDQFLPMIWNYAFRSSQRCDAQMELPVEEGRKIGHAFSQPTFSIAATAQHYDLTTVSRDTNDFEKARVTVFNPWVEAAPRETE
jgi:toxin FitB